MKTSRKNIINKTHKNLTKLQGTQKTKTNSQWKNEETQIRLQRIKKKEAELGSLTYVLSCRMKLEKLLCLKYLGRRVVENLW